MMITQLPDLNPRPNLAVDPKLQRKGRPKPNGSLKTLFIQPQEPQKNSTRPSVLLNFTPTKQSKPETDLIHFHACPQKQVSIALPTKTTRRQPQTTPTKSSRTGVSHA